MLLNVYVSRDQLVTMPPSGLIESAITRRRQKALEMTGFIDRFHLMHLTSRKPAGSEPRRGNVGISQRCIRCARKRFTDYLTTKNAEIAKTKTFCALEPQGMRRKVCMSRERRVVTRGKPLARAGDPFGEAEGPRGPSEWARASQIGVNSRQSCCFSRKDFNRCTSLLGFPTA